MNRRSLLQTLFISPLAVALGIKAQPSTMAFCPSQQAFLFGTGPVTYTFPKIQGMVFEFIGFNETTDRT